MMKKILLVTDGIFHPPLGARKVLRQTLAQLDGFEFQHIRSMQALPKDLMDYSALVIYVHHKEISAAALSALDGFASNGGGILGVHSVTASFKQHKHYFEILGGRFTGHGKVEPITILPVIGSDIFAGIPAFTVKDELYIHEFQPGITPHFTSKHAGQDIPVVWTYRYGQGRVCCLVPGHLTRTMQNENIQEILRRGLAWVSGE
jgi:type 1 glutamine amidotransferase